MASKMIVFLFAQAVFLQLCCGQVLPRYVPAGCGCGSPYLPYADLPAPVVYEQPTTIIQDSTVANNLANALQLLVVSNLLSSTLPLEPQYEVVAPIAPIAAPIAPCASPLASIAPLATPLANFQQIAAINQLPYGCGCGGCGCGGCGCGQYPYSVIY